MISEQEIIDIAKGLYPKYIHNARECVDFIIETLIKFEKITPRDISKAARLYGFSKGDFINGIVEKLTKGDKNETN